MGLTTSPILSKEHQPVPATGTWQPWLLSALSKTASWLPEPYKAIVLFLAYSLQSLRYKKGWLCCYKVLMREYISAQFKD